MSTVISMQEICILLHGTHSYKATVVGTLEAAEKSTLVVSPQSLAT